MMRFRQDDAFQSRDQRERFFLSLRDGPAAFDWEAEALEHGLNVLF